MAERMDVDMSLDDIIRRNRGKFSTLRNRGGRVPRGRGSRGSARGFSRRARGGNLRQNFTRGRGVVKAKTTFLTTSGIRQRAGLLTNTNRSPSKLLISNLDYGVSDNDIKELFCEFGTLKKAVVHYDQSGRSLGTADVVFERRIDAIRAMQQYNGVPLDGRPMKIQITSSITPKLGNLGSSNRRGVSGGNLFGRRGRGRGRGRGGFNR